MGTITKALGLLDLFSVSKPQIGLTEFQKQSGYDKATVYRHLRALTEMGFLEQDSENRNYRLGSALLRLANLREMTFPARDALAPIIDDLSHCVGELAHASLLHGRTLSPVYHHEPHAHGLRVSFDGTDILLLNATASGLAALAFLDAASIESVFAQPFEKQTKKTVTKHNQVLAALDEIRKNGFSVSSESFEIGVSSVAIPIFDRYQIACGGVSVAYPTSRGGDEVVQTIIRELKARAPLITEQLGGIVPDKVLDLWT